MISTVEPTVVERAAEWVGASLTPEQRDRLAAFSRWLATEGVAAGGVGPNEPGRVDARHVADSILFAAGWEGDQPPAAMVDIGTGAGLPAIPLAVVWPQTRVVAVDRSQRRTDLARRAMRVVGLDNIEVRTADIAGCEAMRADMVVARAVGEPPQVMAWVERAIPGWRRLVIGGSHQTRPEAALPGERVLEVPAGVLDRPVWLRIMARP